jgi:RimJ/RimL family protein N-acetyltransferase
LNIGVQTPHLALAAATDGLLEELIPLVRAGVVGSGSLPFDDPMSFYEDSPEREWRWLRGVWAGRARVNPAWWRLYFVVMLDGQPVGMQDLVGVDFATFGTVSTFSWLGIQHRRRGVGREMRAAILHLAFAGLSAREAASEAFVDNQASNRVSEVLGYQPNGTNWATRRADPALLKRWKLSRERWEETRRDDIELVGVQECLPVLGL